MDDSIDTLVETSKKLLQILERIEAHPRYSRMQTNLPEQAESIRAKVPDMKTDVMIILEDINQGKIVPPEAASRRIGDMQRGIWAAQYLLQQLNGEPPRERTPN